MLGMLRCMLSVVSCVFGVFVLRVRRFQFYAASCELYGRLFELYVLVLSFVRGC